MQRQKKSRINTQNSSRKALFHGEKEKLSSPSTASDKIGPVKKEANCAFCVDQSYLSFQVAEKSAPRSMVETTPQLSSNSSFSLETSAIGEKVDKKRREEERFGSNLQFGIEQPRGKFYGFPFFRAIHLFVRGHENLTNIWRTQCGKQLKYTFA